MICGFCIPNNAAVAAWTCAVNASVIYSSTRMVIIVIIILPLFSVT